MTNTSSICVAAAMTSILTVVGIGGCARQPPPAPPPPTQSVRAAGDPVVRVQTLGRMSDTFARTVNQLPGTDSREHRRLMANVFAQLEEILSNLQGPGAGAEFRQQLQIIHDAQEELTSGPEDLSPDPIIDTGLRAARDALASIARSPSYHQTDLTPLFDSLASKINDLDTVRGPLHQVATADAVEVMKQIVSKMSDTLSQQLAEQNAPTTSPATAPSSAETMEK